VIPVDYTGVYAGTGEAVRIAAAAREQSYAPFHGPAEGALFVTDDGDGVVGSRVENSNFTNTIHAVETALGDVLAADGDPAYLVVSTDNSGEGSFLSAQPGQLYEFVDGDFPVIVHEDDAVEQYTVDAIVTQPGRGGFQGGDDPDRLPAFDIDQPYTVMDADDAADQVDAWRDAAYRELEQRLDDIDYGPDDPVDTVMVAAQQSFHAVDAKPDDVLAELHGHAEDAQQEAHDPYSDYPVGVVLLDRDGRLFPGQNMEDADIGTTLHGEGNAFTTAVTWGLERGDPVFLDVHAESEEPPFPCGLCRQTAAEFADPETLLGAIGADDSDVEEYSTLDRHLPDMFRL